MNCPHCLSPSTKAQRQKTILGYRIFRLYRAIDYDGNLVDSRLSEKRDMGAAKQFFRQAVSVVGHAPEQVTTDGHASYPRAVCETMGNHVQHRTNKYFNNQLEQDHRGIKQRYYPIHGFGSFAVSGHLPSTCQYRWHAPSGFTDGSILMATKSAILDRCFFQRVQEVLFKEIFSHLERNETPGA
jgi:hypothetical protein